MKEHPQEKMTIKITGSLLSALLSDIPTHLLYMYTHAYTQIFSFLPVSETSSPLCDCLLCVIFYFYISFIKITSLHSSFE